MSVKIKFGKKEKKMKQKNVESLEVVHTHYIYKTSEKEVENKESQNLKNEGFIGDVKKLYIRYKKLKINFAKNRSQQSEIMHMLFAKLVFI